VREIEGMIGEKRNEKGNKRRNLKRMGGYLNKVMIKEMCERG
jgi:hypothetical protein